MLEQMQRRDSALVREIGERRRTETELERARDEALTASRIKSAFLANMSHEIRTPLNVILGYTSLIHDHLQDLKDDSQDHLLEGVSRASKRLTNTVHGVLDMSRIETGGFDIQPEEIRLGTFLEKQITDYRLLAEKKGLTLTCAVEDDDTTVRFDEYCLTHTIMNLVDNAIKFTHEGGIVVRQMRDATGALSIEVSDTGVGIDESYVPRLYESFSQEQSGYTRKFEGTGLGLALTKRFLEMNGATISVRSEKGIGTTFTIRFSADCEVRAAAPAPGAAPEAATGLPYHDVSPPPADGDRPVVLVVEDDPDSQTFMKTLLDNRYEVLCAATGIEARRTLAVRAGAIQMVLMDLSLKGTEDGLSLTRHIRSLQGFEHLPIVAVTAHALSDDRTKALDAGCNAYLAKPFENRELLTMVGSFVNTEGDAPQRA